MKNLFKYLRKPKSQEYITVVSGLPRSGTSMMMKMLEAGGLPPLTDNLRTADDDNPKGYYEFERVKKLPDGDISWIEVAQGKAVKVISALLEHLPSTYTYRVPNILKDPAVAALISKYKTLSDPLANRVIGSITADITRSGTESALGDVIADAQLEATSSPATGGAVIAFMNPGGIRADLLYNQISGGEALGQVTYGEAFTVQPFSNNMVVMTMTGGQIKLLLEQQYQGCAKLQISNGFSYTVNNSQPAGSKISNIQINGVPIDLGASYRIATNNFLADGGSSHKEPNV